VLLDIQMPGPSGFEVLDALRAARHSRAIPVVALTALAMVTDEPRILAAGFDGYLSKPISLAELRRVAGRFVPTHATEVAKRLAPDARAAL
jgi:CheY-like chemotaxis protein